MNVKPMNEKIFLKMGSDGFSEGNERCRRDLEGYGVGEGENRNVRNFLTS